MPPSILVLKVVYGKLLRNSCCVLNLKLLASTVAEINRESQILFDASLAQTPTNFAPKRCFFLSYCPNPSCVPNLKLIATVAEIGRTSHFFFMLP